MEMIDADRWQHLIETSLLHLRVFNFYFHFACKGPYNYENMRMKLQQFQTNFWCEQYHWYTNYEMYYNSASIYTIPYVWNEYTLGDIMDSYGNSNGFNNVMKL